MKRQSKAEEALARELKNVEADLLNARRDADIQRAQSEARISTLVHQRDRLDSMIGAMRRDREIVSERNSKK